MQHDEDAAVDWRIGVVTTTREVDVARASPLARIWPEQLLLDCSNGRLVSTSMGNLWLVPPTQVGCRNNSV